MWFTSVYNNLICDFSKDCFSFEKSIFRTLLIHLCTFPISCIPFNTITTLESTVLRQNRVAAGDLVTTVW